jgi:hypothetical protein
MERYGNSIGFVGRCLEHSYAEALSSVPDDNLSFMIMEILTYILRLPEISACFGRVNEEGELMIACDLIVDMMRKKFKNMATMPDNVLRGRMLRIIRKLRDVECEGGEGAGVYAVSVIDLDSLRGRIQREWLFTHDLMQRCVERDTIRELRSAVIEAREEEQACVCARCRLLREEESN